MARKRTASHFIINAQKKILELTRRRIPTLILILTRIPTQRRTPNHRPTLTPCRIPTRLLHRSPIRVRTPIPTILKTPARNRSPKTETTESPAPAPPRQRTSKKQTTPAKPEQTQSSLPSQKNRSRALRSYKQEIRSAASSLRSSLPLQSQLSRSSRQPVNGSSQTALHAQHRARPALQRTLSVEQGAEQSHLPHLARQRAPKNRTGFLLKGFQHGLKTEGLAQRISPCTTAPSGSEQQERAARLRNAGSA